MNEPPPRPDRATIELCHILGQRRAFAAVAGRCSATQAQLLRRIHDEKLYLPIAPTWEKFCGIQLSFSRRHADRIIALLNRFGPIYFELAQLTGLSPAEYLAIEPAVREQTIVVNGEALSLIPENAPKILDAVTRLRRISRARRPTVPPPDNLRARVVHLTRRGKDVANRFVELYNSCRSQRDRDFILECATEIRMTFMQLGLD
jgi:hypothetical protein